MTVRACLTLLALAASAGFSHAEPTIAQRARTHWAFRPAARPAVPDVRQHDWVSNPIDAFVLARLEKAGLEPAAQAERRVLLRRAYLDLLGVPPTPAEQAAFLNDSSPDAWSRLIEKLLADPRHGERWGRHWLDVARYADTNGYERDGDKPFAWRYRDYVIDALNADLPYDRFVREQIAGDELPGSDARTQIATTFLRLGTWDDEPANDAVDRYDQLDDVLGVTTAAFLAQTVRCARCHDHKFEPFAQKEYYGLLAVFAPLKRPQQGRTDLTRVVGTKAEVERHERVRKEREASIADLSRQQEVILSRAVDRALGFSPGQKPGQLSHSQTTTKEKAKYDTLSRRIAELRKQPLPIPDSARAYIWFEEGPKAPVTRILHRGNPSTPRDAVEVGLPAVLAPKKLASPKPLDRSTGRRLWLADWIAAPDNPLTARVIANRVWGWHFGTGLVRTPSDFGLAGDAPSHPELLDWLASELGRSGWSLKHLHRLILSSSTYRTSSAHDGADAVRKLALFGRWKQRRLEAESVRDSMLAVSGQLNLQQHGPGVYPALPRAVLATQSRPGLGWGKSDPIQSSRRSVYVFSKRSLAPPELEVLDTPDSTTSCEQRPMSTTAPQALTFLNGAFANEQAAHFADRLVREAGADPSRQVRLAYELALSRPPSPEEERRILAFLDKQARQIQDDAKASLTPPAPLSHRGERGEQEAKRRALASFCLVLFNTAEFFYPG